MIFNDDLLFIHVPKTGGMSITHLLLDVLPQPVYYTLPDPEQDRQLAGVVKLEGKRHESLSEAAEVLTRFGRQLSDFKMIVAVLRNPYDLEVSRYAYLQKGYAWDAGHNQDLALHEDFETFAKQSVDHARTPLETFFLCEGTKPPNLRILRQENLEDDLAEALLELGVSAAALTRRNASHHDDYRRYYTEAAEAAVYDRYRWVFESGFYPRMTFDGGELAARAGCRHLLPLVGPVRQVGPSSGLHHDGWVGHELRFSVRPKQDTRMIALAGSAPSSFSGAELRLTAANGVTAAHVRDATDFSVQFPIALAADKPAGLLVTPSRTWSAAESGGPDHRRLSFHLDAVTFG